MNLLHKELWQHRENLRKALHYLQNGNTASARVICEHELAFLDGLLDGMAEEMLGSYDELMEILEESNAGIY